MSVRVSLSAQSQTHKSLCLPACQKVMLPIANEHGCELAARQFFLLRQRGEPVVKVCGVKWKVQWRMRKCCEELNLQNLPWRYNLHLHSVCLLSYLCISRDIKSDKNLLCGYLFNVGILRTNNNSPPFSRSWSHKQYFQFPWTQTWALEYSESWTGETLLGESTLLSYSKQPQHATTLRYLCTHFLLEKKHQTSHMPTVIGCSVATDFPLVLCQVWSTSDSSTNHDSL